MHQTIIKKISMTKRILITSTIALAAISGIILSCSDVHNELAKLTPIEIDAITHPLVEKALTADEQKTLTPELVLQNLKNGNKRFCANTLTARDHSAMVRTAVKGQYPKAVILSCLDSRIPVEDVFDRGIGDLFVARIAGNYVSTGMLGSMEFGCKISGAKVILVLGHESCGAIKGAIDNVQLGNLTAMLDSIKPAVAKSKDFNGEHISKNDAFVEYVAKNNVLLAIENIRKNSPILKEMEEKGEIWIVGGYYDLNTGAVTFL
jgi:carbonic anhydrase